MPQAHPVPQESKKGFRHPLFKINLWKSVYIKAGFSCTFGTFSTNIVSHFGTLQTRSNIRFRKQKKRVQMQEKIPLFGLSNSLLHITAFYLQHAWCFSKITPLKIEIAHLWGVHLPTVIIKVFIRKPLLILAISLALLVHVLGVLFDFMWVSGVLAHPWRC